VVRIDPTCVPTIRAELGKRGVSHATIYGDFDPTCAAICRDLGI